VEGGGTFDVRADVLPATRPAGKLFLAVTPSSDGGRARRFTPRNASVASATRPIKLLPMLGILFNSIGDSFGVPGMIIGVLFLAFQIWMLVDAIRRQEYFWAACIFLFSVISAMLYYFLVYRDGTTAPAMRGFELPGAADRKHIKELQDKIHHLDKAPHHLELGDIYFQQGKLDMALASYRAAHERDAEDADIRAHLGQCLLRLGKPDEARPLLEGVVAADPRHDYGHTMMALAETLMALDEKDAAIRCWRTVLASNSYARSKVQLAELLIERGEADEAKRELDELLTDDAHAPAFQRKRERVWTQRAKALRSAIK